MEIIEKPFAELSPHELYAILELRSRVFVVEQTCAYNDLDGHDQNARHLWIVDKTSLSAYARVLPPGEKFAEASLGRVISAKEARRTGAGRAIVAAAIACIERIHGKVPIRISAQAYLEKFYGEFGFVQRGEGYLEDGIPHLEMLRSPA
ncbi:MAG: GNAT family N-acetyltransferase [Polyangiales bacterium]